MLHTPPKPFVLAKSNQQPVVNLKRADWFEWLSPPPAWCQYLAEVPGLKWVSDGSKITKVLFHISHIPVLPPELQASFGPLGAGLPPQSRGTPPALLRPYQAETLPFFLQRAGGILGFQMRLGKTATAAHMHNPMDGSLLIVGPLAARDVWMQWIERVHGFKPIAFKGLKRDNEQNIPTNAPAYFIHFDILDAWCHFVNKTDFKLATLIIDELHLFQGRKTKRTSAAAVLTTRADRVIGLTGTPMWSNPDSMYALLQIVTPDAWGSHHEFGKRYCNAKPTAYGWNYSGLSNAEEFAARLKYMMVQRSWKDIAPHLPPTTRSIEPVPIPGTKLAAIESAAFRAMFAKTNKISTVAGYLATLRRKLAEAKIGAAVQATLAAMNNGHPKIVLWAWHKDIADQLAVAVAAEDKTIKICRYRSGDDTPEIEAFAAATTRAVIVCSIAAGGVAIDLSASDYAIFVELDWIPANVYQAEKRTFNPARPDAIVYLYADTPVETKLIEALGIKEEFQNSLGLSYEAIANTVLGRSA